MTTITEAGVEVATLGGGLISILPNRRGAPCGRLGPKAA